MRVLVLDGNENQAVACMRSLARAGHKVSVGAESSWSKAGWSAYCRSVFVYPSPQEDSDSFVQRIVEEAAREPRTLVLPMTERTTLPLSAHRDSVFAVGARMVLPRHETVLRAFDKNQTTRLAASLGLSVPRTVSINDSAQARQTAASFCYPTVLKPSCSEEAYSPGKIRSTGAPSYARDAEGFMSAYEEMRRRCSSVLAQEFIEGTGVGYFALMRDGELRAEFAHRRIRDIRPTGSGSSLRESVAVDPELRRSALAILQELNWHGVAMVEFRRRADGVPVFMEVNGRFWNSLALAVLSGADFPAWLAHMAEYGDVPAQAGYRTGVRCRWLLGDFRHLLEVLRGSPMGYPGKYPGRLKTLINFLLPHPGTYHDNFALRDPLPEVGDWLDFALRRVPGEIKKRKAAREELHVQRGYSHS